MTLDTPKEYPLTEDIVLVITEVDYEPYDGGDRYSPPSEATIEVTERHLKSNDGTVLEYRDHIIDQVMDKYESLWYDQLMEDVSRDLAEEALCDELDAADYIYEMRRDER